MSNQGEGYALIPSNASGDGRIPNNSDDDFQGGKTHRRDKWWRNDIWCPGRYSDWGSSIYICVRKYALRSAGSMGGLSCPRNTARPMGKSRRAGPY